MRRLIGFIVTLLMPILLIGGGGALAGWGLDNDINMLVYIGLAMIAAGLVWGLVIFLWASMH